MARIRRIPPSVLLVWLLLAILVPLGVVSLGRALVVVAFVSVAALFGFVPGGTDGPGSDSSPGSGGPGPST